MQHFIKTLGGACVCVRVWRVWCAVCVCEGVCGVVYVVAVAWG